MSKCLGFLTIVALSSLGLFAELPALEREQDHGSWTADFSMDRDQLSSTGRNPYFVLEPGYTLVLAGGKEQLTISVLDQTRRVENVETRVVEERETNDGKLVEVSRNYFAISKRTNGVYYFGEEVDIYKNDKIVNHEGAWLAGVNGAKFGLMMPGLPLLRARYFQEIAPGIAMDRAEIMNVGETVTAPAGHFKDCLKVEETTPLEPRSKEYKYYAPGIGIIQDGSLKLVRYSASEQK